MVRIYQLTLVFDKADVLKSSFHLLDGIDRPIIGSDVAKIGHERLPPLQSRQFLIHIKHQMVAYDSQQNFSSGFQQLKQIFERFSENWVKQITKKWLFTSALSLVGDNRTKERGRSWLGVFRVSSWLLCRAAKVRHLSNFCIWI